MSNKPKPKKVHICPYCHEKFELKIFGPRIVCYKPECIEKHRVYMIKRVKERKARYKAEGRYKGMHRSQYERSSRVSGRPPYNSDICGVCKRPLGRIANKFFHPDCHERATRVWCGIEESREATL